MSATPALLAAAGGVGFGHAVLPDHWLPLAAVGRAQRYPLKKVAWLSCAAALGHVLVSLLTGAVIVGVGLQFRASVEHAQNAIVGGLLAATGIGLLAFELRGHPHRHGHGHDHGHPHRPSEADRDRRARSLLAVAVPFGAAASPDLTILPVFLAASTAGAGAAVGSLLVFAAVTLATIVSLTLGATVGSYRVRGGWLERWGNPLAAAVLIVIGALALGGVV